MWKLSAHGLRLVLLRVCQDKRNSKTEPQGKLTFRRRAGVQEPEKGLSRELEGEPGACTVREVGAGSASRRSGWPTGSNVRESLSDRGPDESDISDAGVLCDQLRAVQIEQQTPQLT